MRTSESLSNDSVLNSVWAAVTVSSTEWQAEWWTGGMKKGLKTDERDAQSRKSEEEGK